MSYQNIPACRISDFFLKHAEKIFLVDEVLLK